MYFDKETSLTIEDQNIKNKIDYFIDIWRYICQNIKDPNIDFDIMTPHYLCNEILDEINFNRLENKDNKQYYLDCLNDYYNNEESLKGEYKNLFRILRQEFQNPRELIIKQILQEMFNYIQKGKYFDILFESITTYLLGNNTLSECKTSIRKYSHFIIIEFIFNGYNIVTTEKFIDNIFSMYKDYNNIIITNFPHGLKYNDYNDKGKFNKAVVDKLTSLTINDRLNKLKEYFYEKPKTYYYIFPINGIIGEKEYSFNNVIIYNPSKKQYMKNNDPLKNENKRNNAVSMNVLIKENCIDIRQGYIKAIQDTGKTFDFLRAIVRPDTAFSIDTTFSLTLSEEFEGIQRTMSIDPRTTNYYKSLTIDRAKVFSIEKINILSKVISDNSILLNSLHYYRKAEESNNYEEKLLNYWISLENLFNNINLKVFYNETKDKKKINLICDIVSRILLLQYIYDHGWSSYNYLSNECFNGNVSLPENVLNDSQLDNSIENERTIYLYKYLDNINSILSCVNKELVKDNLTDIRLFYFDNSCAKNTINKFNHYIINEIILLYRIRNKIVHTSFYESNFLEYYVNKMISIITSIFRRVLNKIQNEKTIEDIFIGEYIEYEKLRITLEKDSDFNLYKYITSK